MAFLLPEGKQSFTDSAGAPLVGGKLFTYQAGTSTPLATYSDAAGVTPNTNPVILDARGEATIFWNGAYKVTLTDASNAPIWTVDNIEFSVANLNVTASAPGAVARTIQSKFGDLLSVKDFGARCDGATDDTVAIAAAVTNALLRGMGLLWPDSGTSITSSSIPNFHLVKHYGTGSVTRGSDVFYISPTATQTNRIYVNVGTGSNANDGLSASQPKQTFQSGIDALANWRTALLVGGVWRLVHAAGTYARARIPDEGLPSLSPIYIEGPDVGGHPNVPTFLVKQGATEAATGLVLFPGTQVYLKNVKFEDYNGTSAAAGVSGGNCKVYTENAHFTDCYYGITVGGAGGLIDVKGGVFDDCGYLNSVTAGGHAIRGFFHVKFQVGTQDAGTLAGGPIIRNCSGAARAQELCTGHFDWVTVEDNASGLRLLTLSRLNIDGSSFKRSGTAIYLTNCSFADASANTVFGTGADANGRNYVVGQGAMAGSAVLNGEVLSNSADEHSFKTRFPASVETSTSSSNTIDSFTIKAGALAGSAFNANPARKIRCVVRGTLAGTAGFKRVAIRLGASTVMFVSFINTTTGIFETHLEVQFIDTANQFLSTTGVSNGVAPLMNSALGTVDMAVDQTIALQAYVQSAPDSITISSYEWFIQGV